MYCAFYGLTERPFDLTFDPKYFLMTPGHEEALSNLEYGLSMGTGITLLLGEPGTGKTSVLQKALASMTHGESNLRPDVLCINNPTLNPAEFVETLAHGFKLQPEAAGSKAKFLREFERRLVDRRTERVRCVLVIDEAQSLPDVLLEEIRLLANLEWDGEKLLKIVLVGQPALGERLNEPAFRQLKQRIGLRCLLTGLTLHETAAYMAHRLTMAGGDPGRVFTRDAVLTVYQRSGGIPRIVNVVCDNALLTGFAAGQQPVSVETVLEVCADFDLRRVPAEVVAMPAPQAPASSRPRFSFPYLSARRR